MTHVAIVSDSHDQIPNLQQALAQIRESDAGMLLHLGDLCAPFMIRHLAEGFPGPIHIILGNNDGDGRLLQTVAAGFPHVTLHGIYAEVDFAGRQFALIHYPEPARRIAQARVFDVVGYGHNHLQNCEQIGPTYLINPGELLGINTAPSWGLYDAAAHTFKFRPLHS